MPSVFRLRCSPIPQVRIALIGLGQRGMKILKRYAYIKGAEIDYIADLYENKLEQANSILVQSGRPKAHILAGKEAWKTVCQLPDVDLVYISTEWDSHTKIAVEAMKCGKHVAVEVPAATTVDECWQLVHTAEQTQRHCFMTENCCYDFFSLETLEMYRKGLLGTITHCEGAYIHNLSEKMQQEKMGYSNYPNWIEKSCNLHGGNPYPTHGIGPIAQLLGFHRNDRMQYLTSVTSQGIEENGRVKGKVNSTLIKTEKGVTIFLQLDVNTPRPYSRIQTVCGTRGYVQKYPIPIVQIEGEEALMGEMALNRMKSYATSEASRFWKEGNLKSVPNEMNYAMDRRLIYCLNNGLPLDIDVYDAAEWSCLTELTQQSALRGGKPISIPNFLHNELF